MREIQRIRIWGNSYPSLEDGTIYPFHKSPGLLVYKDIANQDAPDTHINLCGLPQTAENE